MRDLYLRVYRRLGRHGQDLPHDFFRAFFG
jgi:hypothetical protein